MNRSDGKNVISFHPIFSAIGEDTKQREESSITASPGCSLAKLFLSRNCEKGEAQAAEVRGREGGREGGTTDHAALTKQHEWTERRDRRRPKRRAELIIQVVAPRRTSISAGNTIITKGHKGMEEAGTLTRTLTRFEVRSKATLTL